MKDNEFKTIGKMLDSALESYETKLKSGDYEMTSKDAEVLAHVALAKLGIAALPVVEGLSKVLGGGDEKSDAKGAFGMKPGSANPLSIFSTIRGFMPQDNEHSPYNNMPHHYPMHPMNTYSPENRRGVPGSGHPRMGWDEDWDTYDRYDSPENRHRRKNGRWVKNEYGGGMDDRYHDGERHHDGHPQNYTITTPDKTVTGPENRQGVPGTGNNNGAGTQGR